MKKHSFIAAVVSCVLSFTFILSMFAVPADNSSTFAAKPIESAAVERVLDWYARQSVIDTAYCYLGSSGAPFMNVFNPNKSFAYCAAYVCAIWEFSGFSPLTVVAHSPYVDNWEFNGLVQYFKKRNTYEPSMAYGGSYIPVMADVIFFTWSHNGVGEHTGIVVGYGDGWVHTIEGNTSGGIVAEKWYPIDSPDILGFGKTVFPTEQGQIADAPVTTAMPVYTTTTTTTTAAPVTDAPAVMPEPEYPSYPTTSTGTGSIEITDENGCWVREKDQPWSQKLGIASTYSVLEYDCFSNGMYHVINAPIEDYPYVVTGWVNQVVCRVVSYPSAPAPAPSAPAPAPAVSTPSRGRIISLIGAWERWAAELADGPDSWENPAPYDTRVGILDTYSEFDILADCGDFYKVNAAYGVGYVHKSVMEVIG